MDYNELMVDFTLTGGAGMSFQANVMIINDDMQEIPTRENLTATLTLVAANVPLTLSPGTGYVTIIDDDSRQPYPQTHNTRNLPPLPQM